MAGSAPGRRTNDERAKATRAALITAARRLFEQRGYSATATEDVVRAASVTRGALYHHFGDKRDLLRAVVIEIQEELLDRVIAAAAAATSPWAMFVAGWLAVLDIADRPEARVLMVDAPPSPLRIGRQPSRADRTDWHD